jgi:hypothetical protein
MDRNVCLRSVVSFQVSTIADCSQVLFDTIKRVLGNLAIPISLEIVCFHGMYPKCIDFECSSIVHFPNTSPEFVRVLVSSLKTSKALDCISFSFRPNLRFILDRTPTN